MVMNARTYKSFFDNMIEKSSKVEDPISLALDFFNTEVAIDNRISDFNIEVFEIDVYNKIVEDEGLDVIFTKNIDWDDIDGLA